MKAKKLWLIVLASVLILGLVMPSAASAHEYQDTGHALGLVLVCIRRDSIKALG